MENGDDWLSPNMFQHVLFCFTITLPFSLLAALSSAATPFLLDPSSLFLAARQKDSRRARLISWCICQDAVADLFGVLIAVVTLYISKPRLRPDQTGQARGLDIV